SWERVRERQTIKRLKGKRGVKREQTTRLISEASAGLETADLVTVTAWRERISASNQTLQSLNAEIEDQVPLEDLVAEYTTVSEYDDDATRVLALLSRGMMMMIGGFMAQNATEAK
ncbi:hypothetical protein HPB47_003335, partial [Ixodes persulcatus]